MLKFKMLLLVLICPTTMLQAEELTIKSFSPSGLKRDAIQVRAEFSESMIPIGDPEGGIEPFTIDCNAPGTARWIDDKNWVYDFAKKLPAGIQCRFSIKDGTKSLSSTPYAGEKEFQFTTGGPSIRRFSPDWSVHEEGVFIVALDAEPDVESVRKNAFISSTSLASRISVDIVDKSLTDQIIKSSWICKEEGYFCLVIKAKQTLTPSSRMRLVWGRNIATKNGVVSDKDQIEEFHVRDPFTITFSCERTSEDSDCVPLSAMRLDFSFEVDAKSARNIVMKSKAGLILKAKEFSQETYVRSLVFEGPFPEREQYTISLPRGLVDIDGRKPKNANRYPLKVATGTLPPLVKFPASFGIIEKDDALLPLTVRNIEKDISTRAYEPIRRTGLMGKILDLSASVRTRIFRMSSRNASAVMPWLAKVTNHGTNYYSKEDRSISIFDTEIPGAYGALTKFNKNEHPTQELKIARTNSKESFEVIGMPLEKPGLYIVEIESKDLGAALIGNDTPMFVSTAALVTNMSVHFKKGESNSLAWVTALDTGRPIENALVSIRDCSGTILWSGLTNDDGVAMIDQTFKNEKQDCRDDNSQFYSSYLSGLLIAAEKSGDFSFVHDSWNDGIESWRFQLPYYRSNEDGILAHTIMARSLLRAGETLPMKHILRSNHAGPIEIYTGPKPENITIRHRDSGQEYNLPIAFDNFGIAESTWQVPKEAKLGTYEVDLNRGGNSFFHTGEFRVEEFRIPLLSAKLNPKKAILVNPTQLDLDISISYLNGGAAGGLPIELNAGVQPGTSPFFADFEDYNFTQGSVEAGTHRRDYDSQDNDAQSLKRIAQKTTELDAAGSFEWSIPFENQSKPVRATIEASFKDPNGQIQTASRELSIWTADYLIGLKSDHWISQDPESLKMDIVVVDLEGKPVVGRKVSVQQFKQRTYSHRKKLLGGFYAYESFEEIVDAGRICEGTTGKDGKFTCAGKTKESGNLLLQATTNDEKGKRVAAFASVYVAGKDSWWFDARDSDRMDVLAEKKSYDPGENARLQVRMPFQKATALVAVEASGILDYKIEEISGQSPTIEIPVKANYSPNVYVSVLAVRGRTNASKPTAMVDLDKPSYKLGIGSFKVGWGSHKIKVKVEPKNSTYKVRQTAEVKISASAPDGSSLPADAEVAIAVVDSGLLQLMKNVSWDLLEAMMMPRNYGIENVSSQMHVVGKRHFGLKAIAQGGGGGVAPTRELFDTLVFWKARVKLEHGEAIVKFPLNDSLTSFEIVAVATAGSDMFGRGNATIRSTQDIILLPGLSPFAREGDKFPAEVTLRNTTSQNAQIEVSMQITSDPKGLVDSSDQPINITLSKGESQILRWNVDVPVGVRKLTYETTAKGADSSDRLRVEQSIYPAIPTTPQQSYLTQVGDDGYSVSVQKPERALPKKGGIQVSLKSKLGTSLEGVRSYMISYPYTCMEQQISRAIALNDKDLWVQAIARLPSYLDSNQFVKYFPSMERGSALLTSYILAIAHASKFDFPEALRDQLADALKIFIAGKVVDYNSFSVAGDLLSIKIAALDALSRWDKLEPGDLDSIDVNLNLVPTSVVLDWMSVLHRMGDKVPSRLSKDASQAENVLRTRLDYRGTRMNFSTEKNDFLWWLMTSPDQNAARLTMALVEFKMWKDDVPKIAASFIGRLGEKGYWDLTTANAWGVLAARDFSNEYEDEQVSGSTRTSLGKDDFMFEFKKEEEPLPHTFAWPDGAETLRIKQEGTGKPWAFVTSLAAVPRIDPLFSGYTIKKTVTPLTAKKPGVVSVGDILRIKLELEAQSRKTWVVVNDPIPAGASVLGSGLGNDSSLATAGEKSKGYAWPVFQERSMSAFRSYYDFVEQGAWSLEYSVRLNAAGTYQLPPTRVEAMYSPDAMGELPNSEMVIMP